jgi:hypothetical protein
MCTLQLTELHNWRRLTKRLDSYDKTYKKRIARQNADSLQLRCKQHTICFYLSSVFVCIYHASHQGSLKKGSLDAVLREHPWYFS